MEVFLFIVLIFTAVFLAMYCPVLWRYKMSERAVQAFRTEMDLLGELYKRNVMIITERRGEGSSRNSSVQFSEVHVNQSFAVNTILDMINREEI